MFLSQIHFIPESSHILLTKGNYGWVSHIQKKNIPIALSQHEEQVCTENKCIV